MALSLNSTEYHAFATFTFNGVTYCVGTQSEVRNGTQFDGVLQAAPQLEMDFGTDALTLTQAANIDIVIADGIGGRYRAVAQNILDGVQISITLVNRFKWNDGSTTETTYSQQLTIVGRTLSPQLVTLHLQDLEDVRLSGLYPANLWQVSDFSGLSSDDAGKAICEPVGTAIKLPCVLLRSDTVVTGVVAYWYGVCTGTPKFYAISAFLTNEVRTATDLTGFLFPGAKILVAGSAATDNVYTVAAISFVGGVCRISVNETITAGAGSGNIVLMPMPLTVYRNKRIVSASEYIPTFVYPFAVNNGNFASGGTGWTSNIAGTGTAVFATGSCTLSGTNGANTATISQMIASGVGFKGAWYAVQITLGAGTDGFVQGDVIPQQRLPAGQTTTVFVKTNLGTSSAAIRIGIAGSAGTTAITNVRPIPLNLSVLQFSQPQIDFNGSPYTIEADVIGVESRDCCTEIMRLLTLAGVTPDPTTFSAAFAQTFAKLVDCDYGRTGQRKFSAIIDDLLVIARAGLSRGGSGNYTIWQDIARNPSALYDESAGDPLLVEKLESTVARPASVGINYAPSSSDATQMTVPLSRTVVGGIGAPATVRELRYLRDATTADQLVCYLALRAQFCQLATVTIYRTQNNIGDVISITCPWLWSGVKAFTAWALKRIASGNQFTLMEYDPSVYTYTAGTLPANATTGYQPDYSFTPPAAPTALIISAAAAHVANDGTTTDYVTVQATPPSVNWESIWFAAIHNVTGELTLAQGASIGAGNYGVTLPMLRPGEVYQLQCYAVNSNNLQGVVQSTFNATAIGGGSAVTTFTTPGQAATPPVVGSITATQGTGKLVNVAWPTVAGTNISAYAVERQINAGAFAQVWQGNATNYVDKAISYVNTYTYRVRALDTYGNFSASYVTSSAVAPSGNVTGGSTGDITGSTVDTVNRTSVTTVSASWNSAPTAHLMSVNTFVAHGLSIVPLAIVSSGATAASIGVTSVNTTNINVTISVMAAMNFTFNSSGNLTGPAAFTSLFIGAFSGTFTASVW